jgi:ubiquinone/menaquinone biosynthesis C-methylase UbiE
VDPEGREKEAFDRLVIFRDRDVLEIGCGEGRTARHITRTAASVLGVDPDEEAIVRARDAAVGRCTFLAADAVTLDLPPADFDVVVFSRSLC